MANLPKFGQLDLQRRLALLQTELNDHPRTGDIQSLLQDLQLYQLELELQNRELLEARQALEEARDQYADLYDFAPVGYLTLDRTGEILEINLAGARLLGIDRSAASGMALEALLAPGESAGLFRHLNRTLWHNDEQTADLRTRPRGGESREVHLQSIRVTSASGDLVCRTAMMDVTEQKRAERTLAERDTQYRAVIETTSDGFWMVDEQGRILAVNDAYAQRSGYTREELLTMRIQDLDAIESAERVRAHVAKVRRDGGDLFETLHRAKNGEVWPVEISATYTANAGGCFFGFIRDISERKSLQQKISEVSAAEQERIGREIHDGIGQQLTALAMLATSLGCRLEQEQHFAEARAANELLRHLQQTLKDARSLASGLSPIRIGPDGLPDALSLLVERTQGSSGVHCRFDWPGSTGPLEEPVSVNLYRIAQEAIHNAVKHAQASHIEVGLHGAPNAVVLSVRDDGVGIAPESGKHHGLGMDIMQHRARVIGADLTISPCPEGGTAVECTWFFPD